jgi:lysophospholipase L1-like esterase
MRLLTVGDSFTYGDELSNRTSAWPNLVAARNKYELTNLALPGSGNTNMVRSCIEQVDQYDIVIVAWSHFARIEFSDEKGTYDTWPGYKGIVFIGDVEFRKDLNTYITKHYNDSYLYRQYLINIILTQHYLKTNNKKYIMLDAFGNTQILERNENEDLISQIDSKFYLGWPDESMMEWTYGCAQGPGGHFLEDGHRIVAEKINEHIRNLGWVS